MFGFLNNPDKTTLNELGRQTYQAAQLLSYVTLKKCLPPKDGEIPISLEDEELKKEVCNCFNSIIDDNLLHKILQPEATDIINHLSVEASENSPSQLYENTLTIMAVMNSINGVCKMYYVDFPKSKKLFSLVNEIAKICPPALTTIFGEDLPTNYRNIWPHLSSIIEYHRANG